MQRKLICLATSSRKIIVAIGIIISSSIFNKGIIYGQINLFEDNNSGQNEFILTKKIQLFSDSVLSNPSSVLTGLQLLVPNGGETWRFGSIPKIEWSVGTGVTNVKLEYSTNNGTNWTLITSSTVNDGSFLWELMPNVSTTNAIVKVTDAAGSENDISDLVFTINSIAPNITASPVRILPLGNSITFDVISGDFPNPRPIGDRKSYRYPLHNLLHTANYNFDFVGGEPGGFNFFDDFQGAGWPGITAVRINRILTDGYNLKTETFETPSSQPYLNFYPADIILLHAGTNEPRSSTDIESILNKIDTYNPNVWVVVALIINTNPATTDISTFNESVRLLVNSRINYSTPDKILLVNMENILGPSDYAADDDTHPNDVGYAKMADVWYNALQILLGSSTDHAPIIKSTAITNGVVDIPYIYDVAATGKPDATFSLLNAPAGMTINSSTGIINWTPTFPGSFNVQVQASNTSGSNTQSFAIEANKYTSEMIHYWKLEEDYGFPYFDCYGVNHGIELRFPPTSVAGKVGKALDFNRSEVIDGVNPAGNRITISDDNTFDWAPTSSFSIEMWIKRDQATNGSEEEVIIGRGFLFENFNWRISTTSDSRIKFVLRSNTGTGPTITTAANTINTGDWYHIAAVRNNTDGSNKIYVNGTEAAAATWTYVDNFSSVYPITIGSLRNSTSSDRVVSNRYDGIIDELAIYNKALNPAEILQHYNNGLNGIGYEEQQILADISVILQGPYTSSSSPYMSPSLNSGGYLPTAQPYNIAPWSYSGTEAVSSNFFANNPDIVDWVLVELRDKNTPSTIISTRAGFLKNDGKIVDFDGVSKLGFDITPDAYYIAIKHRNHLAIMCSDSARAFFNAPVFTSYDFTDSQSKAYTNGSADPMAALSGGKYGMIAGDGNADGGVFAEDYTAYQLNQLIEDYLMADYNLDGGIFAEDYTIYQINQLRETQIP